MDLRGLTIDFHVQNIFAEKEQMLHIKTIVWQKLTDFFFERRPPPKIFDCAIFPWPPRS